MVSERFVLNYGYNRFNFTLMYSLVVVLIIITQCIQSLGNFLRRKGSAENKTDKRRK